MYSRNSFNGSDFVVSQRYIVILEDSKKEKFQEKIP